jgi:hypothetical protein
LIIYLILKIIKVMKKLKYIPINHIIFDIL